MATNTLDPNLLGLVDTLDMARDNVPSKLICSARGCNKFLVNAYKGICCDGSICESCFQTSANACPVCELSPYSLESERCKVNSASRKFAKEWLKKLSKARAAESEQVKSPMKDPTSAGRLESVEASVTNGVAETSTASEATLQPAENAANLPDAGNGEVQQSIENPDDNVEPFSDPTDADAGDDEVEIQVEPSQEDQEYMQQHMVDPEEQEDQFTKESQQVSEAPSRPGSREKQETPPKTNNFETTGNMGFGNVDFNQMMQMMQNNPMGFNPMMGMPMGMNPMANMFGGFGGPTGGMNGMNGMNMGMGFNPNMFGFQNQNQNMWQNSNQNAFSGMGNDFNYGFNQQQNYNADFQSGQYGRGYGRGRGRGRGGFNRGRGNFQYQNQNPIRFNNFHNPHEQQQFEIQSMQAQMNNGRRASKPEPVPQPKEEEPQPDDDDDFAPGGQDDVQEALGDDYVKKEPTPVETIEVGTTTIADEAATSEAQPEQNGIEVTELNDVEEQPDKPTSYVQSPEPEPREEERKPIAEAYAEDLDMAMPPPTAPSGPSGRYGEKDYGFRARGHGRYSRSRGSIHMTNGPPPSPVRSTSASTIPRPVSAGTGVVGAPTGPKAMREPPLRPSRQPSSGGASTSAGFQIMGRASMGAAKVSERDRSLTPNGYDEPKSTDRLPIRQSSRRDEGSNGRLEDERDRYDQKRREHKSKRDSDYDMQDADNSFSRSSSHDRSKSHKSRRDRDRERDTERNGTDSRHSSRRYHDETTNGDYEMNDYGDPVAESDSKSRSHRKHRDEKYSTDRDRDRERERDRDRDRGRDKPRDKDRKRSRHDRDYEDESDHDRRHRSSKHHKKEHTKDLEINGRASRRESQVPTPVATPTSAKEDKDPYTLEREARQRERMLKEDQRREKAATAKAGGGSGMGRRVSYKTEEDAQRGMEERESAMRAQRWR